MAVLEQAQSTIADTFNQLIGRGNQTASTGLPRAAIVFTSTLRSRAFGPAPDILAPTNPVAGAISINGQTVLLPREPERTAPLDPLKLPAGANEKIVMAVNPKSIRFEQGKRFTKKNTLSGTVFYHFTNNRGQNNDTLQLTFRGNTGNIDRRGSIDPQAPLGASASNTGAIEKLLTWHDLYLMTREPMYLGSGIKNIFTISYISPLMPFAIDFKGFFTKVLEFEENAEKPFSREYTMQFIVQETHPDLDEALTYVSAVLNAATLVPQEGAKILGSFQGTSGANSIINT